MSFGLRLEAGQARLLIEGRPVAPLIYATGEQKGDQVALFHNLGVDVVAFAATCDFHLYRLATPCWKAPGLYDHTSLDARAARILAENPQAYLLPRVYTCSPPWWDAAHPGQLVVWEDGTKNRPLLHGAAKNLVPSLASPVWKKAQKESLSRFVRHLEEGPFGSRVMGYMVGSGTSEEWFHWGTQEGYLADDNPLAEAAFRTWLAARYGDDSELSRAWGRNVSLEEAVIPPPERRRHHATLGFFHPEQDRDVLDHALFMAELMADRVQELAAVVKRETSGHKLFGCFFGYLMELAYHPDGIQRGGHLLLSRLLQDRNIDFLASPSSYARRFLGDGFSMPMVPGKSLELAGKVFFHENDVRTHLLDDDAGYGRTEDRFQTGSMQRREFIAALTAGQGSWWYDMTGGWYDDPATAEDLAELVAITRRAQDLPRQSVAQVALVLDPESVLHAEAPMNQMVQLQVMQALELSRMGAPFEVILLEDLLTFCPYRLLLFPNLFFVTDQKLARLRKTLAASRATALFLVAPGLASGGPETASALVGMTLDFGPQEEFLVIRTREGLEYGSFAWWQRPMVVTDNRACGLGTFAGSGAVGLASKEQQGWTSLFSGAPAVPGALLRAIARQSGVHLYLEGEDAVYACNRFLGIHARQSGVKQLKVPQTSVLLDLQTGFELQAKGGLFACYLPRGETRLFFRGSKKSWGIRSQGKSHRLSVFPNRLSP